MVDLAVYKQIFNQSSLGMIVSDVNGHFIEVNGILCKFLGYSRSELLSKNFQQITYKEDLAEALSYAEAFESHNIESFNAQKRYVTKTDEIVWGDLTVTAIRDSDGEVKYFVAAVKDITADKLFEKKLQFLEAENFHLRLLNYTSSVIVAMDRFGHIVYVNQAVEILTGYRQQEVEGKIVWDVFLPPEVKESVKKVFLNLVAGDFPSTYENEWIAKDGSYVPFAWSNSCIIDEKGDIDYVITVGVDITEKNKKERIIQALLNSPKAQITLVSTDQTILEVNEAASESLGVAHSELKGKKLKEVSPQVLMAIREANFDDVLAMAEHVSYEYAYEGRILEEHMYPIFDQHQQLTHISIFSHDVTESRNYQQEVERMQVKFFTLFNEALDPILLLDPIKDVIADANQAAFDLYGYDKSEFLKLKIKDLEVIQSEDEIRSIKDKVLRKGSARFNSKHKTASGKILDVLISARAINLDDVPYLFVTFHDLTAEKNAERKLLEVKNELEKQKEFITKLIDEQPSMTLLTDGWHASFMNHSMLRYFQCKDLNEFQQRYECVSEHFIDVEELYFHLGKIDEGGNWVEVLKNMPQDEHIVAMKSLEDLRMRVFNVSISPLDGEYVVNFSDISDTFIKQKALEDKALHDNLTKAYNRNFFEQEIDIILAQNRGSAIVMADIDYFKQINDTYGHDVGDQILQQLVLIFSQTLRKQDIVVRWGGEEFVIILEVEDKAVLYKVLENLRLTVAAHQFPMRQKVTCSFGSAIHQSDQSWQKTLKIADIALYQAKKAGRNKVHID